MAVRRRTVSKKKDQMWRTIQKEILGLLLIGSACLGIVILYVSDMGLLGEKMAEGLRFVAGAGSAGPFLILAAAGFIIMGKSIDTLSWRIWGLIILWLGVEGIFHLSAVNGRGGLIGAVLTGITVKGIGAMGSYIIFVLMVLVGLILALRCSFVETVRWLGGLLKRIVLATTRQLQEFGQALFINEPTPKSKHTPRKQSNNSRQRKNPRSFREETAYTEIDRAEIKELLKPRALEIPEEQIEVIVSAPLVSEENSEERKTFTAQEVFLNQRKEEVRDYKMPPVSLLDKMQRKKEKDRVNISDNVRLLENTLHSFGVQIKVVSVTKGPSLMRYEIQPAPGVKVSKIVHLADDIALNLAVAEVRIEAPIPGKSLIGIEVPNKEVDMVSFREVLECKQFQKATGKLTLILGKDISGHPVSGDLSKMPHLLIAGATGSGKSVCINTIIASLVYKARPDEVKILLIDPKVVELTNYNGIPHLLAPVVTDPAKAASALKWIVREMEIRYELFAAAGVRDVLSYNALLAEQQKGGLEAQESALLPYVVVIIDELSDLMMVAPTDVEENICRLAQMARASGIHLIVATQRPSVNVITGLIKANIPSRIAFAVSSQIDSRTILDMGGAEKLLGRGDMLYYPMGASKPLRVQGCFLSDGEVRNVVDYLKNQAQPEYREIPQEAAKQMNPPEQEDTLFYQAAQIFIECNAASVSLLQRKLRVGYARAARIVDLLEEKGVVGPYEGSKPRLVLLSKSQFEQKFSQSAQE